jgi:hypothetical protein
VPIIAANKVLLTLLLEVKASLGDMCRQMIALTEAVKDLQPSSTDSSNQEVHSDVVLPLPDRQSLDKFELLLRNDERLQRTVVIYINCIKYIWQAGSIVKTVLK